LQSLTSRHNHIAESFQHRTTTCHKARTTVLHQDYGHNDVGIVTTSHKTRYAHILDDTIIIIIIIIISAAASEEDQQADCTKHAILRTKTEQRHRGQSSTSNNSTVQCLLTCSMTYKAVHIGQSNYHNELIQPYQPVRTLRSSTSALLVIPFVRSDFASDALSVSAQDVRSCAKQATFKSRLKSHLFSLAFTV